MKNIFLKLIIDIGNTRIKLALFNKKEIVRHNVVLDLSKESIDNFCKGDVITSSIVSTVRSLSNQENDFINSLECILLNKETALPIKSSYKSYIGSDRISAVIGASYLFPDKDIWVFDAGTCLTIDFIDKEKKYHGGRITLGLKMRYTALNDYTSELPLLSIKDSSSFKGDDTESSIISGVQQGIISEVRALISDYKQENNDFVVVFTGGDLSFFEKELKSSIFADPFLVLRGLNEILDYNDKTI